MQRVLASPALLGALLVVLFSSTACVERILQVRSDPPGAAVYVNGDEVGTTPLDHPFTFYGTVEVTLRAKGRISHRELKYLGPPWYEVFPFDFFSELVVPWRLRDVKSVEVLLAKGPGDLSEAERTEIQGKAEELRAGLPETPRAQR